jgi:Uma2 family endonuclease
MNPVKARPVVVALPPPGGFTTASLPALAETVDAPFELLDGEVSLRPLEPVWHNEAVDILVAKLRDAAPPEITAIRSAGIDLGTSMPVADIAVVPRELLTAGNAAFPSAAVLLAVEVTAPGTITRDRVLRPAQYASAGIECYWRAGSEDGAIVIRAFDLDEDCGYTPRGTFRDRLQVELPWVIDFEIPKVTW